MSCYYRVLGVARTATTAEIKAAFRTLALQYHPDMANSRGSNNAKSTESYTAIAEAYRVLSNSKLRSDYDSLGVDAFRSASMYANWNTRADTAAGDPFSENGNYSQFASDDYIWRAYREAILRTQRTGGTSAFMRRFRIVWGSVFLIGALISFIFSDSSQDYSQDLYTRHRLNNVLFDDNYKRIVYDYNTRRTVVYHGVTPVTSFADRSSTANGAYYGKPGVKYISRHENNESQVAATNARMRNMKRKKRRAVFKYELKL